MADSFSERASGEEPIPSWDSALTKYVHVWLWSILVGATTSLAFSFLSYRGGKWGVLGLGLVAILSFGALAVLGSLLPLGRFLFGYLLPVFFASAEVGARDRERAGLRLYQSFRYIILAILARLLMAAVELALSSTSF